VPHNCNHIFAAYRPSLLQILGVLAVLAGVAVASWPSGSSAAAAAVAAEIEPVYLLLCVASFAFPALATIIKERIFKVCICSSSMHLAYTPATALAGLVCSLQDCSVVQHPAAQYGC
jgi:drug/metabolite transporter (DMT)-like permease